MSVKPPQRLEITSEQMQALKGRIKNRRLDPSDYDVLLGVTETVERLSRALAEKNTAIGRLCKYLLGAPTEKAKNVLKDREQDCNSAPEANPDASQSPSEPSAKKPKPKGHGKKAACDYTGANRICLQHPCLKVGDPCPGCDKGKLYELAMPSVFVHVTGSAPLEATVYERARLRCNLCGELFVPELPAEVGKDKFDASAPAMLALLKYGCGMPFNRLEKLQDHLGQPLPASTQWDIVNAAATALAPVWDALVAEAAQGRIVHNDDTTAKVLEFLQRQDPDSKRKGIFTTGIVSDGGGHRIALFMTGGRHAGENLTELLRRRRTGLSPPIQMCDALNRNESKEFETILANCLAHARRQFVELVDRFPDDCAYVIERLAEVYHNDGLCKKENLSSQQRLAYHRQHSAPVMDALHKWCQAQIQEKRVEPNSGLGKAIGYMLKRWDKLTRFLQVPDAPLDNNLCERALKYAILHRKNALFYKTQRGAYVGDLFMSLIHTCQLAGVNPLDYIGWLLKTEPKTLQASPERFMPWLYQQPAS